MSLGTYCKELLAHEHFNTVSDEFEAQSVQHLLLTQPHETQQREAVYAEIRGKREFISLLLTYAQQAEALIQKDAPKGHPDDEELEEIDYR